METLKNIITIIGFAGIIVAFIVGLFPPDPPKRKKKKKNRPPKCSCKDPNECHQWCYAKEAFKKDFENGRV